MKSICHFMCGCALLTGNAFAGGLFCKADSEDKTEIRAVYSGTPGALTMTLLENNVEVANYGSILETAPAYNSPVGMTYAGRTNTDIGVLTVHFLRSDNMSTADGFFTRIVGDETPRVYTVSCQYFE